MASSRVVAQSGLPMPDGIQTLPHRFLSVPALPLSAWTTTLLVVFTLLVFEQVNYRLKKKHLPGPTWKIPVIGQFLDSLYPDLDQYKRGWAFPLSAVAVFNYFIVMSANNDTTRKILNSPTYAEPALTSSAKDVLDHNNWVFLTGKVHADYRKGLNVLFTRRALSLYLRVQETIRRKHFARWLIEASAKPEPMMFRFRDLNLDTSLRVFCGDHIAEADIREISDKYWLISKAMELVTFPLALPGTVVYNAIKARKVAMKHLTSCVRKSKTHIAAGGEVACLLDGWNQSLLSEKEGIEKYSDIEMGLVVLSFIFASQDAMSSSITWAFQLLADHPEVFAKVRAEQDRLRGSEVDGDVSMDVLDQMVYTRCVVKEVLRLKPPVLMIPYKTTKDFPITDDYSVPKDSLVIPALWNSLHDGDVYPAPDDFNPDRFMPGGNSEKSDPRNYLVFGAGPHKCIGQEYVYIHMTAVVGAAASLMEIEHERTKESYEVKIIPTIFPKDDCRLRFSKRQP